MKKQILSTLAGAAIAAVSSTSLASPGSAANAAPIGLQLGVATCDQARQALKPSSEKKVGEDILVSADQPSGLVPGAESVLARCSGDVVIAVQMKLPKGGMGNLNTRDAYANLKRKYRQVAGGAMPELGNGYARFAAGNSVIEQDAPHLSFEFTLTYYTKSFYDSIVEENKRAERDAKDKKNAAL